MLEEIDLPSDPAEFLLNESPGQINLSLKHSISDKTETLCRSSFDCTKCKQSGTGNQWLMEPSLTSTLLPFSMSVKWADPGTSVLTHSSLGEKQPTRPQKQKSAFQ